MRSLGWIIVNQVNCLISDPDHNSGSPETTTFILMGLWEWFQESSLSGALGLGQVSHKLTCFRDEWVQTLGVPELLTTAGGAALLQPILLGRADCRLGGRDTTRGSLTTLSCLLDPLSLETHSMPMSIEHDVMKCSRIQTEYKSNTWCGEVKHSDTHKCMELFLQLMH